MSTQTLLGWKHVESGGKTYIMKKRKEQNVYKVVVSDLKYVWVQESSEDEILKTFQDLNPLIECSDRSIVNKIWSLVDTFLEKQHESSSSSLEILMAENASMQLKFRTVIDGHAFKLNFKLTEEEPNAFFNEVTVPLLSFIQELLVRQDLLCSLLEKKDVEIAQYKLEGATLSRCSVETRPFSTQDFLNKSHVQANISDSNQGILKILEVANLISESDMSACEVGNSPVNDQLESCKQEDQGEMSSHLPSAEALQDKNIGKVDGKVDVKTVKDSNVPKLPRKKKPKLNL